MTKTKVMNSININKRYTSKNGNISANATVYFIDNKGYKKDHLVITTESSSRVFIITKKKCSRTIERHFECISFGIRCKALIRMIGVRAYERTLYVKELSPNGGVKLTKIGFIEKYDNPYISKMKCIQ